jgi:hypothetical protein
VTSRVTVHYRRVWNRQCAHGLAIDDDVIGPHLQAAECTPHREDARLIDVESLDLMNGSCAECAGQSAFANASDELVALFRSERFGVIHSADRAHVRRHDHRASNHWSGDRAAPDFIDAGEEWPALSADVAFDVCPPLETIKGAAF